MKKLILMGIICMLTVVSVNFDVFAADKKYVVCIDAGHQKKANLDKEPLGPNSKIMKYKVSGGTTGVYTKKPEHVLTLEASLILKDILEKRGIKVVMTRNDANVNISNSERAKIANLNKADLFIRLHADGSNDKNVNGLSVLTPSSKNIYTKNIYEKSLLASQCIVNSIKKNASVKVSGISYRDDMTGFNWSKTPVTLVELGYMTNIDEDKKLSNPIYIKKLMNDIADGIQVYLGGI